LDNQELTKTELNLQDGRDILKERKVAGNMRKLPIGVQDFEAETGLPKDKSYLECGLPDYLQDSLEKMKIAWAKLDSDEAYLRFDGDFCCLQSDINCAEVNGEISSDQAWYLREEYLGLERIGV
jgi:hypothetical protein